MKLHHLGFVGRSLAPLARRFANEGAEALSGPIDDPVQRVTVQFLREPSSGELWEIVVPLSAADPGPLESRLERGGGLDHVCYELETGDGTIEERVAAEQRQGGIVVCEPVHAVAFQRRIAFVFRRSGRLVELLEPRPAGALL